MAQDGTDASYPRNYHGVYLLSETVSRGDDRLSIPKNEVVDTTAVAGSDLGGFIWAVAMRPGGAQLEQPYLPAPVSGTRVVSGGGEWASCVCCRCPGHGILRRKSCES